MDKRKLYKGSLVALLFLALSLCFAATALATDQSINITQSDSVTVIREKIQAAITDVGSSGVVTVSGSKTGVDEPLDMYIPAGVTVKWVANYEGAPMYLYLIGVFGGGVFEVAEGGLIKNTAKGYFIEDEYAWLIPCAIRAESTEITVSGGMVIAAADDANAIETHGDISVSGGTVKTVGQQGYAINAMGENITILLSGTGMVESNGRSTIAVYARSENVSVTVSGNAVVNATGEGSNAMFVFSGKVMICDDAIVQSSGGILADDDDYSAINPRAVSVVSGEIIIGGMATVTTIGEGGWTIDVSSGDVTITGNATVQSNGDTFYFDRSGYYYITPYAIFLNEGNVKILESATVKATGEGGMAIHTEKGKVTVSDSAIVQGMVQPKAFAPFIQGFENNTFRGDSPITREQFVAILYRLNNAQPLPTADKNNPSFKDVAPARWSYDAIEWALEAGIVAVDAVGNFRPAEPLTRAEMAVMLVKADNLTQMAENTFSDLDDHPDKDDILKAVAAKIFTGYTDGSFKPEGNSTRAEAVTALIRYLLEGEPTDEMWQGISLDFSDVSRDDWAYKYIALAVKGN